MRQVAEAIERQPILKTGMAASSDAHATLVVQRRGSQSLRLLWEVADCEIIATLCFDRDGEDVLTATTSSSRSAVVITSLLLWRRPAMLNSRLAISQLLRVADVPIARNWRRSSRFAKNGFVRRAWGQLDDALLSVQYRERRGR